MRALWITRDVLSEWQPELESLEALASYPLGDDSFRISHGANYFAFFERMGDVKMRAFVDDDAARGERIVAMACGILRPGPPSHWYLCDAKVRPSHRGQRLLIKMVRDVFLPNYARAPRGYFVAMNPSDGRPPLSVRLTEHFGFIPRALIASMQLELFSSTNLADLPSDVRWLSLAGVKDLVLTSTGEPMRLLHATRGEGGAPRAGFVHMWCAPAGSARARERGIAPMATATVVHHRMGSTFDGSLIETHEI